MKQMVSHVGFMQEIMRFISNETIVVIINNNERVPQDRGYKIKTENIHALTVITI